MACFQVANTCMAKLRNSMKSSIRIAGVQAGILQAQSVRFTLEDVMEIHVNTTVLGQY